MVICCCLKRTGAMMSPDAKAVQAIARGIPTHTSLLLACLSTCCPAHPFTMYIRLHHGIIQSLEFCCALLCSMTIYAMCFALDTRGLNSHTGLCASFNELFTLGRSALCSGADGNIS
ncbi:hypothetical protein ABBQ32_008959 [Trebouxia sp. C0010 RCD-2024]